MQSSVVADGPTTGSLEANHVGVCGAVDNRETRASGEGSGSLRGARRAEPDPS